MGVQTGVPIFIMSNFNSESGGDGRMCFGTVLGTSETSGREGVRNLC